MTFGESIKTCLSKYATFSGRASRSEFWWFYLFVTVCAFASAWLGETLLGATIKGGGVMLMMVVVLALVLPIWSAMVRRLHDTGRSGWWIFTGMIPAVGGLFLLVLLCLSGTPGENRFGHNPLDGDLGDLAETFS